MQEYYVDRTDREPAPEVIEMEPEVLLMDDSDLRRLGIYKVLTPRTWTEIERAGEDGFEDSLTRADLNS